MNINALACANAELNPSIYDIVKEFIYVENKSRKVASKDSLDEFQWNKHSWSIICKHLLSHIIFGFDIKLTTQLLEQKLKSHLFEHHKQFIAMHKSAPQKEPFKSKYVWTVLYTADHCHQPACFGVFSSLKDALQVTQTSLDLFCKQAQEFYSHDNTTLSKHVRYQKTLLKSNMVLETQHLPVGNSIPICEKENSTMDYYREIVICLPKERFLESFAHRWRIEKWINPYFQETLFSSTVDSFCDVQIICQQNSSSTLSTPLPWQAISTSYSQQPYNPVVPVPLQYTLPFSNGLYCNSCIFVLIWYQSYRKENFGHILKIFSSKEEAEDAMLVDAKQYCKVNEVKLSIQVNSKTGFKFARTEIWGDQTIIWEIERFANPFQF